MKDEDHPHDDDDCKDDSGGADVGDGGYSGDEDIAKLIQVV